MGKYRKLKRCLEYTGWTILTLVFLFNLYVMARMYLFASCVIPTTSMTPTLISGDYIIASLRIPGYRNWKDDGNGGHNITRGWKKRDVRTGDVVVFSFPYARGKERMVLCNDVFYCKRCVATPGEDYGWTWKGKSHRLYLPAQGDEIRMDSSAVKDYRKCIEYETRQPVSLRGDTVLLGDSVIHAYRFRQNYYFMQGDNTFHSDDSRFWGPVPEDFILGVGKFIWFSRDRKTGEIRWERMFRGI